MIEAENENYIAIVDFGSQTTHLIGRRLRDLGVEVRLIDPADAVKEFKKSKPAGIILSGGPASVYEPRAPRVSKEIFKLGVPILGICYGWQLIAYLLGGKVEKGKPEYGPTQVEINRQNLLLKNLNIRNFQVWMSHGDEVKRLPIGFQHYLNSNRVKAVGVADLNRRIYGLQFHPEVKHTENGNAILKNFLEQVCGLPTKKRKLEIDFLVERIKEIMNEHGEQSQAIAAVSGGVDSTVASAIVARAIGKRMIPVYCDNGLMRLGTKELVKDIFNSLFKIEPMIIDCKTEFLNALKGVIDPEEKRNIIGHLYVKHFEQAAKKIPRVEFLVQGTIYSDVIESQGSKHADKIKSHHNVGGLPAKLKLQVVEPIRDYYKDEVRELGRQLSLPEEILMQQPFPGPGQAIRILGKVTNKRLSMQQQVDQIMVEVMKESGWYNKVFQSFPVMTGAMSTAVMGDGRKYGEVVALRIYDSSDIMTAGWTHLPYDMLQMLSTRIVNEVQGVSRVVYDITTKPPATMEWE